LGFGGGVSIYGGGVYVRIMDNLFGRDTVAAQTYAIGGGLELTGPDLLIGGVIQGNVFRENIAEAKVNNSIGGGLSLYGTESMLIQDNIFKGNISKSRDGFAEGGAVLIDDTEFTG